MGLQDIEKKTSETGKLIESLQKDCRYSQTNLVLHISPVLKSFTRDVTSIGKIVSRPVFYGPILSLPYPTYLSMV
jgi:hypothetical protein